MIRMVKQKWKFESVNWGGGSSKTLLNYGLIIIYIGKNVQFYACYFEEVTCKFLHGRNFSVRARPVANSAISKNFRFVS